MILEVTRALKTAILYLRLTGAVSVASRPGGMRSNVAAIRWLGLIGFAAEAVTLDPAVGLKTSFSAHRVTNDAPTRRLNRKADSKLRTGKADDVAVLIARHGADHFGEGGFDAFSSRRHRARHPRNDAAGRAGRYPADHR